MAENMQIDAESRAFAFEIIGRIESNLGISVRPLFEQDLSVAEIRARIHQEILTYVERQAPLQSASEDFPMGGETEAQRVLVAELTSDVNPIPNLAVSEYNFNVLRKYGGSEIRDFVKRTCNGLALLNDKMTAGEAAATILASGLVAFATAMIVGTVKALRAGAASLRAAVTAGVRAMGKLSVVVGVAAVIITELLLYLIFKNEKVFLGMVFNNTDLNLIVKDWRKGTDGANAGDLFMNTGYMKAFMDTNESDRLDSPLVQVKARDIIAPGDEDNIICGGIFTAEKKAGLFGTEGVMVLADRQNPLPRFALLFACPYTYDNGTNVAIDLTNMSSAKSYFDALYKSRGIDKTASAGAYTLTSRVADPRGGEAAGIAILDAR